MHRNTRIHTRLFAALCTCMLSPVLLFAQGNTGIGINTPQERLDVNGAMIVRQPAAAITPVPGTIQWNTTGGYHDGRTSAGTWIKLENDNTVGFGDYITLVETCVSPTSVMNNEYTTPSTGYFNPTSEENPFNTWWMDDRTLLLYKASQLITAGVCAGDITAIGFNIVTPGAYSFSNLTIKMGSTALTTLSGYVAGLTTVYSVASHTPVVGANDFTLTTPFVWNGTDNILIEVCYDNSGWAAGCTVTADADVGYLSACGYYNDIGAAGLCTTATTYFTDDLPQLRVFGPAPTPTAGTGSYLQFNYGVVIGSPVLYYGADFNGPGTLTALGVYDDNSMISDYVFDEYFDGQVRAEDLAAHDDYKRYTISEMADFVEKYRHLPTIEGRETWEQKGGFSLGELLTQLWVTAENQAIYITELNSDLKAIEKSIVDNEASIRLSYINALEKVRNDQLLSSEVKATAESTILERLHLLDMLITNYQP